MLTYGYSRFLRRRLDVQATSPPIDLDAISVFFSFFSERKTYSACSVSAITPSDSLSLLPTPLLLVTNAQKKLKEKATNR